jgi:hypothetical protein
MPSPEQIFKTLMDFLKAPTWGSSHQIVNEHPGLINVWVELIDTMLTDPATVSMVYPERSRSDATAMLKTHRAVLARCQQIGITQAFAEVDRQMRPQRVRHGIAWFWALVGIVAIVAVVVLGMRFITKPSTPISVAGPAPSSVAALAPPSTAPVVSTPNVKASEFVGTWTGTYTCTQGVTGLRLVIRKAGSEHLKAIFNFYPVPSNQGVPSGSFAMRGSYSSKGVVLRQKYWINQPQGYVMVNLSAPLPVSNTMNGTVVANGSDCTTFSVHRVTG